MSRSPRVGCGRRRGVRTRDGRLPYRPPCGHRRTPASRCARNRGLPRGCWAYHHARVRQHPEEIRPCRGVNLSREPLDAVVSRTSGDWLLSFQRYHQRKRNANMGDISGCKVKCLQMSLRLARLVVQRHPVGDVVQLPRQPQQQPHLHRRRPRPADQVPHRVHQRRRRGRRGGSATCSSASSQQREHPLLLRERRDAPAARPRARASHARRTSYRQIATACARFSAGYVLVGRDVSPAMAAASPRRCSSPCGSGPNTSATGPDAIASTSARRHPPAAPPSAGGTARRSAPTCRPPARSRPRASSSVGDDRRRSQQVARRGASPAPRPARPRGRRLGRDQHQVARARSCASPAPPTPTLPAICGADQHDAAGVHALTSRQRQGQLLDALAGSPCRCPAPAAPAPRRSRARAGTHRFGSPAPASCLAPRPHVQSERASMRRDVQHHQPLAARLVRHARHRAHALRRAQHLVQLLLDLLQRHHLAADLGEARQPARQRDVPVGVDAGPCRRSRTSRRGSPAPSAPACAGSPAITFAPVISSSPSSPERQRLARLGIDDPRGARPAAAGRPCRSCCAPASARRTAGPACSPQHAGDSSVQP